MTKINVLSSACFLIIVGCSGLQSGSVAQPASATEAVSANLADPSLKRCIDDGYETLPLRKDGIVRSYLCINPESKLKCDSWRYYRGECHLTVKIGEK